MTKLERIASEAGIAPRHHGDPYAMEIYMPKNPFSMVDEVDHGWQVITTAGDIDEVEYDDSKDHTPCPDCNASGRNPNRGWYMPLVGPRERCKLCEGAGWI